MLRANTSWVLTNCTSWSTSLLLVKMSWVGASLADWKEELNTWHLTWLTVTGLVSETSFFSTCERQFCSSGTDSHLSSSNSCHWVRKISPYITQNSLSMDYKDLSASKPILKHFSFWYLPTKFWTIFSDTLSLWSDSIFLGWSFH